MNECPVCKKVLEPGDTVTAHFSKEGTWCNHAGWVLKTGLTADDPPILGGVPLPERVGGAIPMPGGA